MTLTASYTYNAVVRSVYDGDTFDADIDLGFDIHVYWRVRLAGCNAIELHDKGGVEARDHLAKLLPVDSKVVLQSMKLDKFSARCDAVVMAGTTNVTEQMIADGYAAAWDGRGPRPVPPPKDS